MCISLFMAMECKIRIDRVINIQSILDFFQEKETLYTEIFAHLLTFYLFL